MKLTPIQARNKIRKHLNEGNGIYIDGRYYDVRVHDGKLQVSDFSTWWDVWEGAEFRNSHGRTLFTYEKGVIMLYAVMLTLCMVPRMNVQPSATDECGTYVINIDTDWHTKPPCMDALVIEGDKIADVWNHDARLTDYLGQYNIKLPVGLLTDYDLTCEPIEDQDIP